VSEQLVELLVVSDRELEVSGDDTRLFVVSGGVTGELEDLGREVCRGEARRGDEVSDSAEKSQRGGEREGRRTLENSSEVDGRSGSHTLGVVALLEQTVDSTDGELDT
jgi:hypothetical protein